MLPVIAIIGRPNVGKSTLFNRLIGKRYAITSPIAGTTRDRIYHEAEIAGYNAILVDTGGMEFDKKVSIEADVQTQARIAVEEANIIYFIVDSTQSLTKSDLDCASFLRKSKKRIILIANKVDHNKNDELLGELYELGLGEAIKVSSMHYVGFQEMEDATKKTLKEMKWPKEKVGKKDLTRIAIVGKPNAGKSSLVNALLGQNRLIVSEKPGTTIDATDTEITNELGDFVLIDTAGIRRRGKMGKGIEKFGYLRALQAISRSDVTCLTMDFSEGIANQDLHISEYLLEAAKGVIILVNKSDLMNEPQDEQKKFLDDLQYRMSYLPWAPVLFTSTITKKNIHKIFEAAKQISIERNRKIGDELFNTFTRTTTLSHPPTRNAQKIRITKGIQVKTNPPVFAFTVNKPELIHFSYRRFMENEIRRKFGFYGTAIRLEFDDYRGFRKKSR